MTARRGVLVLLVALLVNPVAQGRQPDTAATGRSAEKTVAELEERICTRFFGEHTAGFSTVNQFFALADGAILNMTVGVDVDRDGKPYIDGLTPDELLPGSDTGMSGEHDPVVQSDLKWLRLQ